MAVKRTAFVPVVFLRMCLWIGAALCVVLPAAAQSLFPGGGAATPAVGPAGTPLLQSGAGPLFVNRSVPVIEARALALTDVTGLERRRRATGGWGQLPSLGGRYVPPSPGDLRREAAALMNTPPRDFSEETDLICAAVSIYHEARNQPRDGQAAVVTVILNRANNPQRWGHTPCEVVVPVQFSYLRKDRSFARIRNMRSWNEAVEIAAEVLMQGPDPRLQGADHYHATYVDPPWNRAMDLVERIDDHIFWRSRGAYLPAG